MESLTSYRAYFAYRDDKGQTVDQDMSWPLDTYKIIQEYDVPSAMKEFKDKFPKHRLIGLAGTEDLSPGYITQLMSLQGHKSYVK